MPIAFANLQGEGNIDLAELIVNRGAKIVNEVFETAQEMKTSKATQECKLKSLIELLLNRCGTRVHRNCSQTTAFHVTHLTTLLRSFWRKFLEKSVANCDKNVLVVSAKQDIPRFSQTWHNKVCVGRRCKPRRRVSEIFLKVTTNNHLT